VGATLASGEDGVVNTLLKVSRVLEILPEENKTSAGATESLVAMKRALVRTRPGEYVNKLTWWW